MAEKGHQEPSASLPQEPDAAPGTELLNSFPSVADPPQQDLVEKGMKKLWQNTNLQTSLRDTVSGLSGSAARYVKQTNLFSQNKDGDEQQYFRLPIESARKLKWYDQGDVSKIVNVHARERQELEDINDALREVIIESGVSQDKLGVELVHRLKTADDDRATKDSVGEVLLASLCSALQEARQKCASMEETLRTGSESAPKMISEESVEVCIQVAEEVVSLKLRVQEKPAPEAANAVDFRRLETLTNKLLPVLRDSSESLEVYDKTEMQPCLNELTELLTGISTSIGSTTELQHEIMVLQTQNRQLSKSLEGLGKKYKEGSGQHTSADVIVRAQNMCAVADERSRNFLHRAELAEMRAQKSKQSEQDLQKEVQKAQASQEEYFKRLVGAEEYCSKLVSQISDLEAQREYLGARVEERERKIAEMTVEVSEHQQHLLERDELLFRVGTLEDTVQDLRSKAGMSDNYRQLVRELEESCMRAEEELLSTARAVTDTEKKLKKSEAACRKHEERYRNLESKYRKLEGSLEAEVSARIESAATDASRWPSAAHNEVSKLQEELDFQSNALRVAGSNIAEVKEECAEALQQKEELLAQIQEMQEGSSSADQEKAALISQLKRQVVSYQKEITKQQLTIAELEKEHHNMLKNMKAKAARASLNGDVDSRGSGSFHGNAWANLDDGGVEMGGIDKLYLKNVVFKFIDAMAKGKVKERDALLPVVATVLQASPQEFKALKIALGNAINNHSSRLPLPLWTSKK